ncbi:MAG: amidophosphoribosyltransferase [Candidatus Sungbacteria bacterium RIFCSPLOWO2_01_FULL_47_10]|uniref:Amidophosphoribosyltransferase n=1 Tax=Candidatus Sungbacteria bacterium RIFCSPLOWO2_01_FULL_47_10 TaxID=1802276 RepID=A0A1G2L832_9BACT|nr:MAG: amidophosphoribosyltransferase [Candidatus Sungbacteria bacterium RIFCSPLOWO2_01_FULL_47_10]
MKKGGSMCGLIGVVAEDGSVSVSEELYAGLWSLQHRGKESAGIVTYGGLQYRDRREMGTVDVVFRNNHLSELSGNAGIGHVRYSTAGASCPENVQPIEGVYRSTPFWIAHNGNLTNTRELRDECMRRGYFFRTTTDTEVIAALIYFNERYDFLDAVRSALSRIRGTYSLVLLYKDSVYGIRDSSGNRPLVYGERRGIRVIASESVACDVLGIPYVADFSAGMIRKITPGHAGALFPVSAGSVLQLPEAKKFCIFEYVYFSRPDARFDGRRVKAAQRQMGRNLWRESPVDADVVVPVLDSGKYAAEGFSRESGIPMEESLFRSHYVGRTFIEPLQERREKGMQIKFNPIAEEVSGKRVAVVDDSIVRATAAKKVTHLLRKAGAQEVHLRISSPPYRHPCYYGIDTYRIEGELIAKRHNGNIEEIRKEIGVDSLGYLSLAGLVRSILEVSGKKSQLRENNFCHACFSGEYHIRVFENGDGNE